MDGSVIDLSKYRFERAKEYLISAMTREQLDQELKKGHNSVVEGRGYTEEEADGIFSREFGIID